LHCGFDVPLANGLQIGVIAHEHPPWGNALVRGKPFLLECHVLHYTKIDNPIMWYDHWHLMRQQTFARGLRKLDWFLIFHHFSSSNNFSQNVQVFYNKNKAFRLTCEFCLLMQ
jgi:hypothetical protein